MTSSVLSLAFVLGTTAGPPAGGADDAAWERIAGLVDRKAYPLAERALLAMPLDELDTDARLRHDALLARVYAGEKRYEDAEPLLVRLIDKDPALSDRHLFELASTRFEDEDFEGALTAAKGVDAEGLYAAQAEVIRISSLYGLSRSAEAQALCSEHSEPLPEQSAELLTACGRAFVSPNGVGKAATSPAKTGDAAEPAKPKRDLGVPMLRYVVRHHVTRQQSLEAKDALLAAEPQYKAQLAPGDAAFAAGERWLKHRRLDAAATSFALALSLARDPDSRSEALYRLADVDERKQKFERALSGYERAAAAAPASDVSAQALFAAGSLATRMKNLSLAQKLFQQLLIEHPLTDGRGQALFGLGFAAYLGHDYEVARQFFSTLLTLDLKRSEKQRARYWYGRSLEALEESELAQVVYSEILRDDPVGYYAVRGSERLTKLDLPALELPFEAKKEPTPLLSKLKTLVGRALALAARAFRTEAVRLLDRLARGEVPTHEDASALSDAYAELGETLKSDIVLAVWRYDHLSELSASERLQALRARHPRHYETTVAEEARRMGLKIYDVFAVIRQESRFITTARSPSGARGLMQLMPPTAHEVAHAVRVTVPSIETLYKPELNVRLGTYYLAQLVKRFTHKEFAFAAYNAGPGNLGRWLDQFGDLPLDVFCELIPFEETRDYVQRVVGFARGYELTEQPKLGILMK